jgi:hypothetical protein
MTILGSDNAPVAESKSATVMPIFSGFCVAM